VAGIGDTDMMISATRYHESVQAHDNTFTTYEVTGTRATAEPMLRFRGCQINNGGGFKGSALHEIDIRVGSSIEGFTIR